MTQNDFLYPLFTLSPYIVAIIVLVWGFGSLLIVAIKTKTVMTRFFINPKFMLGDLFLLPLAGGLITFFYQEVSIPLSITTSPLWNIVTLAISLFISLGVGAKLRLLSLKYILGLPHGLFHVFFTYLFLAFMSKGLWQLLFGQSSPLLWATWLIVMILVVSHLGIGMKWTKILFIKK